MLFFFSLSSKVPWWFFPQTPWHGALCPVGFLQRELDIYPEWCTKGIQSINRAAETLTLSIIVYGRTPAPLACSELALPITMQREFA